MSKHSGHRHRPGTGPGTLISKEECMFTKEFIKNLAGPPKSITNCPEFKKMAPQRIAEESDGDRAKGSCQREREKIHLLNIFRAIWMTWYPRNKEQAI